MATDVRVLHLVGSPTDAFFADLSVLYARSALQELQELAGYEHLVLHVSPDGTCRFPVGLSAAELSAAAPVSLSAAIEELSADPPDLALPQLFCLAGMTSWRSLLDVLGIPFIGNTADVMALGADKAHARAVVAAAGVPVARGQVVRAGEHPTLPLPVVVKPVRGDNSVGMTLVRDDAQLDAALTAARTGDAAVLVESYVELGREVRCAVLERDAGLVVLPLEEYAVDPVRKPVRDADDKLRRAADGGLELVAKDSEHAWVVPASDPVTEVVAAAARTAHRALGCRHYSLFDFRVDPYGRPVFLEAGLYCSFAPSSVVVTLARAAGIGLPELFATTAQRVIGSAAASR